MDYRYFVFNNGGYKTPFHPFNVFPLRKIFPPIRLGMGRVKMQNKVDSQSDTSTVGNIRGFKNAAQTNVWLPPFSVQWIVHVNSCNGTQSFSCNAVASKILLLCTVTIIYLHRNFQLIDTSKSNLTNLGILLSITQVNNQQRKIRDMLCIRKQWTYLLVF